MPKSKTEAWVRLGMGAALNLCLWSLWPPLSLWSGYDRQYYTALVGGALAAAALVFVVPTFWRGQRWQIPIAILLLCYPGAFLLSVVQLISSS